MKIRPTIALSILVLLSLKANAQQERNQLTPAIFSAGVISTEHDEFGVTFTPDLLTCLFAIKSPATIQSSTLVLCVSYFENGVWTKPEIAPFSGKYKDFNPMFSPDGNTLFFISNRPDSDNKRNGTDIWSVKRSGKNWSDPVNAGAPLNSPALELSCSITSAGTMYFVSTGTTGNPDIYYSRFVNGKYETPVALDSAVNSAYSESDIYVAPDESYILFSSQGRPDAILGPGANVSYPRSDLYISFRKGEKWQQATSLGAKINTDAEESNPFVSPDGKNIYFTSERNFVTIPMKTALTYDELEKLLHQPGNGHGDIYTIPAETLLKN